LHKCDISIYHVDRENSLVGFWCSVSCCYAVTFLHYDIVTDYWIMKQDNPLYHNPILVWY